MSWKTFHNRGEILRDVVDTANTRADGVLPMDVVGVAENFKDELDLIGALVLKWSARLSGNVERALAEEPVDLESAVVTAWRTTAEQLRGLRMVLDHYTANPSSPEMDRAMGRSQAWEWGRLAAAAGLSSGVGGAAVETGHRVEERARTGLEGPIGTRRVVTDAAPAGPSFADRIRAVLAA